LPDHKYRHLEFFVHNFAACFFRNDLAKTSC
jgi:hypothetical protein